MNRTLRNVTAGLIGGAIVGLASLATLAAQQPAAPAIEFNRDIRPILADTCYQCHGPDSTQRKAELRLDSEESAFADRGGYRAIVPGKPEESELFQRITAEDETKRMPLASSGRKLTGEQIDLLRRWIEQGAVWQKHWSFIPPRRPDPPALPPLLVNWVRNPIDAFVAARFQREGLLPSAEADKTTLIRRVTLDLTGLPPTPAEVDAFLLDNSPDACEKVVDRLLASPRYGERMGARWLDAARYADTNGYQSDGERHMWRWRDWVIDAFNRNMPFDRFTIEQLAGDMLPGATLEQRIATGFNRNHRGNGEGGIIPEEYAVEYVVDRVDTTATVWLGLTMGCGRCHDHKFDPISQNEFYQVFAYFNNLPEKGRAIKYGNSPPMIKAPTKEQQRQLEELQQQLAAAESRFTGLQAEAAAAQAQWEQSLSTTEPIQWTITEGLLAQYNLDGDTAPLAGSTKPAADDMASLPPSPLVGEGKGGGTAAPASAKFQAGDPAYVPGRIGQAADFDGSRFLDAGDVGDFGFYDKFSCAAWIYPKGSGGTILSRMTDVAEGDGYYLSLHGGKLQANFVKRWLDDALRVETQTALAPEQWHHVLVTYDGSRVASGVKVYVNGREEKLNVLLDELNQSFATKEPLRIGGGGGPEGRFHGAIDDVRIYNRVLSPEEATVIATPDAITAIAALPAEQRTPPQAHKLRAYFLEHRAPPPIRESRRELVALNRQMEELIESFPTTMVMEEMPTPRDTCVLIRGQYDKPGELVSPGVPAVLSPLPPGAPNNRLGFAKWLVDAANPLTARVAVNRSWQMYFGTGLVKTTEDFGSQGEPPSHPELLDWLATELMRSGWDMKALQKLIVTSATYRQTSKVTPAVLQKDPENRLLARGPRLRLSAEMLRDQALFASGLLVEKIGGPSVKPYQPPGLWKELADTDYVQDKGENLYRRSLYTFWKRTIAPPSMITFDASPRETCTVRETRTNTPLQALTLMNEVTFVEAARVLAQRIMAEGGATPEERIAYAFRLAAARRPRPPELQILRSGFDDYLAGYRRDRQAALDLLSAGESPRPDSLDPAELAAYTAVASLILNLDEVVTKE